MKDTIELKCSFSGEDNQELREILIAELSTLPFECFQEEEDKLFAYIEAKDFNEEEIKNLYSFQHHADALTYSFQNIKEKNWNEEWEKNFEPIIVEDKCVIYAPFHKDRPKASYEIEIMPKMSFGTGHHATTYLMIQYMFEMEFSGKQVLDMGCGTAVLAILAEKLGAQHCLAIDNNDWAYENALENVALNACKHTEVKLGDATIIEGQKYDTILANINRNVLLEDIPAYVQTLNEKGHILFSGILTDDFHLIQEKAEASGLQFLGKLERKNWNAALFVKL